MLVFNVGSGTKTVGWRQGEESGGLDGRREALGIEKQRAERVSAVGNGFVCAKEVKG